MNTLDIILSIPLLAGLFFGFKRGLVMELSRIVALVVGVYVAVRFSYLLTEYLYLNTDITHELLPIAAFCMVMLGMMILIHLLAKLIDRTLKTVALGWALRITGAAFGTLRMAFILSILLLLIQRSELFKEMERSELVESSMIYGPLLGFSETVMPALESVDRDAWTDKIDRKTREIRDKMEHLINN